MKLINVFWRERGYPGLGMLWASRIVATGCERAAARDLVREVRQTYRGTFHIRVQIICFPPSICA
jgi:hypothetical protein